jgi:hypothetical protein
VNHSSLTPELPVGPERSRPSVLLSTVVLLGVGSALVLTAPMLIRSLKVLLAARAPGSSLPSVFEVTLGLLGVLALGAALFGMIAELRTRAGGFRWRRRRQRKPWEEYLTEQEAQEQDGSAMLGMHRVHLGRENPMPAPITMRQARPAPPLRLVEATPWPLGSGQPVRNRGRVAPVTRLALPVTPQLARRATMPATGAVRTPAWHEPASFTPYPFSVWSYHDNRPDDFEDYSFEVRGTHPWLWTALIAAGIGLAGALFVRAFGISMHR